MNGGGCSLAHGLDIANYPLRLKTARFASLLRGGHVALPLFLVVFSMASEAFGETSADTSATIFRQPDFAQLSKVIVVSKREEDVRDAPGTVYIITDKDIERYGWKDMREVLWAIPNIDMYWNWNGVNGGQRGFVGNTAGTLLLIDGREAQNLVADEAQMQNFPVHRIKRVEILQGPGSALYGSSANEGMINIVTKVADPNQSDTSLVSLQGGESEMKGAYAVMRRNVGDVSMGLSTSYFSSQQDYPELRAFSVDDARYTRSPALDSIRDHDPSHAIYPVENQTFDFTLSSKYFYAGTNYYREGSLTGIERARARFGERMNDRWDFLAFSGLRFAQGAFQGFVDYTYMRERLNSLGGTTVAPSPNKVYRPERHRVKAQGTYRFSNQTLVFGYDGWMLNAQLLQSANPGGLMYPFDPFISFQSSLQSVFGENTFYFYEGKVKINLGFRVDKQQGLDPSFTPRGGIVYQINPEGSVKLLYGRGLRAPNSWEVDNAVTAGIGQKFPPRKTDDLEVNYVQNAGMGKLFFNNSVSAYRMTSMDNFNQVLVGANYQLVFVPDETILGVEDFLRASYGKHGGFLGGRWIDPTKVAIAGEQVVADVPIFRGKLGLYEQALPWLLASVFIDASGEVKTDANSLDGKSIEVLTIPGWVNTNINLRFGDFNLGRGGPKVSAAFYVENIFDEIYYHPNHRGTSPIQYLQTPRNIRVTTDMSF